MLIHNDIDTPVAKKRGAAPVYLDQIEVLLKRHPKTTIIWAHSGRGQVIRPVKEQAASIAEVLKDPGFSHVYLFRGMKLQSIFAGTPGSTKVSADLIRAFLK